MRNITQLADAVKRQLRLFSQFGEIEAIGRRHLAKVIPDQYLEPQIANSIDYALGYAYDGFSEGDWSDDGVDPINGTVFNFHYADSADPDQTPGLIGIDPFLPNPLPAGTYEVLGTADIPEGDYADPLTPLAIRAKVINIPSNTTLENAILVAEDSINFGAWVEITNSVLVSGINGGDGLLKFGSNMIVGGPCDPILNVGAYATGKLTIQSNTTFTNAELVTSLLNDEFDLQTDNIYRGVTIQSTGDVNLGSNNQFSGCPDEGGGGPVSGPGGPGGPGGFYVRLVE